MGACVGNPSTRRIVTGSLVDQILRVKLTAQQAQLRLERQLKIKDDLLLQAFGAEPTRRSKTIEKAMINRTVYTYNIKLIYKYIEMEAQRLLDAKLQLQKQTTFASLIPSVNTIVYCSNFINDDVLLDFAALIRTKFRSYNPPKEEDIRLDLVRHHGKTEDVSFEMENTYMFQFCVRNNLELSRVNQAGHQYRYGAGTVTYSQQS